MWLVGRDRIRDEVALKVPHVVGNSLGLIPWFTDRMPWQLLGNNMS